MVTWYDILDVMPGATTEEIQGKYELAAGRSRSDMPACGQIRQC